MMLGTGTKEKMDDSTGIFKNFDFKGYNQR